MLCLRSMNLPVQTPTGLPLEQYHTDVQCLPSTDTYAGHLEQRRRTMMGTVDRANRIKCEINLIGGERSEMSPLARMMVSNDRVTENDC